MPVTPPPSLARVRAFPRVGIRIGCLAGTRARARAILSPARRARLAAFCAVALLAAASVPTASAQSSGSGTGLEYRIGPEDVLHVSVWQEEDLDRKVLVRPDGGISFPLAGDLQVSGRTPLEVQEEIRSRLQRFVPDAEVTVAVDTISGYTVFVLGEVNAPGQFTLGRYVDVVQALTLAGGVTPYASERNIRVLRRQDGREITYEFDFRDIQRGRDLSQNIILQSGDVVVVP